MSLQSQGRGPCPHASFWNVNKNANRTASPSVTCSFLTSSRRLAWWGSWQEQPENWAFKLLNTLRAWSRICFQELEFKRFFFSARIGSNFIELDINCDILKISWSIFSSNFSHSEEPKPPLIRVHTFPKNFWQAISSIDPSDAIYGGYNDTGQRFKMVRWSFRQGLTIRLADSLSFLASKKILLFNLSTSDR